jgi:hypothetical protein
MKLTLTDFLPICCVAREIPEFGSLGMTSLAQAFVFRALPNGCRLYTANNAAAGNNTNSNGTISNA